VLVLVLVLGCGVDGRADKKRVVRFTGQRTAAAAKSGWRKARPAICIAQAARAYPPTLPASPVLCPRTFSHSLERSQKASHVAVAFGVREVKGL
jgi:hypothetical protein